MGVSIFIASCEEHYAISRNRSVGFAVFTFVLAGSLFLGIATLYRWGHSLPLGATLVVGYAILTLLTFWLVFYRIHLQVQEMYERPDRDEHFNRLLSLAYTTLILGMMFCSMLVPILFVGIGMAGAALSRR